MPLQSFKLQVLDIQTTAERRFTINRVCGIIRSHSHSSEFPQSLIMINIVIESTKLVRNYSNNKQMHSLNLLKSKLEKKGWKAVNH